MDSVSVFGDVISFGGPDPDPRMTENDPKWVVSGQDSEGTDSLSYPHWRLLETML